MMGIRSVLRLVGRIMSWIGYGFLLVVALWTLLWWCSGCSAMKLNSADIVLGAAFILVPLALLTLIFEGEGADYDNQRRFLLTTRNISAKLACIVE